ncbi:MAG TPA: hypothetical protein VFD03_03545 [Clostridia bacterium]|nr:hypothetical protein [Clostridia bacterium]
MEFNDLPKVKIETKGPGNTLVFVDGIKLNYITDIEFITDMDDNRFPKVRLTMLANVDIDTYATSSLIIKGIEYKLQQIKQVKNDGN